MSREILKGATDEQTQIRIVDATDGTPETGVTSATPGLALYYVREGSVPASISVSDLSTAADAHTDGGLIHLFGGYYRLDLPDAAVAPGADWVLVGGTAAGMVVIAVQHPLVDVAPSGGGGSGSGGSGSLSSLSSVYTSSEDVRTLLSVVGETQRVDDDYDGSLSAAESGYLTRIINWATARVNFYLLTRYPASRLVQSWIVNDWTTVVAAYLLCCRRGNPPAGSIAEMYEQVMKDLEAVRSGEANLPDTEARSAAFPSWSAVTFDPIYRLRKARVQRSLSERRSGAVDYDRAVHHPSDYLRGPYT